MAQISLNNLSFTWPGAAAPVLRHVTLHINAGERILLRGPSGAGKSTVLSAISGVVDVPVGAVEVAGKDVGALAARKRDRFRADHMGLIFQVFNLLPWLSARDNILMPCCFSPRRRSRLTAPPDVEADRLMDALGLDVATVGPAKASALSVGQQQRVAAARALIGSPEVILADEPTSALDPEAKDQFMRLLSQQAQDSGAALLVVSHDPGLERHFDRTLEFAQVNASETTQ